MRVVYTSPQGTDRQDVPAGGKLQIEAAQYGTERLCYTCSTRDATGAEAGRRVVFHFAPGARLRVEVVKEQDAAIAVFHAHLDACPQCREHAFALCHVGHGLLYDAAGIRRPLGLR
jgi:hypothetical protein